MLLLASLDIMPMNSLEQPRERVLVVDFGSQYTQLLARRIREQKVYCEVLPYSATLPLDAGVRGVILSGGPCSVLDASAPGFDFTSVEGRVPVLGVCYGAQLMVRHYGGQLTRSQIREYGKADLTLASHDALTGGLSPTAQVWMSHGDTITQLPAGWLLLGSTEQVQVAMFAWGDKNFYGVQFHPEVTHTLCGQQLLHNFLVDICGCRCDWSPEAFIAGTVPHLREQVGGDGVVLGLSGGVDSSVAALLLHRAIGSQLHCIFVDTGLLRKGEYSSVLASYQALGLQVEGVDASEHFFAGLKGVTDPEAKRKIVGRLFVEEFERVAKRLRGIKWLGQGTIYPDVIESARLPGASVTIKSHHNVGGLPEHMGLSLVEPLRELFKDEVRQVGSALKLPDNILWRHPFPGPGLAIRVLGEVTRARVHKLQEADAIFIDCLRAWGEYSKIWQAGAILLPVRSVGVMGDERSYDEVLALRAVTSVDGMTADWYHLPYDLLAEVSNAIINHVRGINRVVFDVSSKPPATIEWE